MTAPLNETEPSPVEELAVIALRELFVALDGFKAATRYPKPAQDEVAPSRSFVRVEAAGGAPANEIQFDQDVILNTYYAQGDEVRGLKLANRATARLAGLRGVTIVDEEGVAWTVNFGSVASLPTRAFDPAAGLTRYRSMVSWRVTGGDPQA